MKKIVQNASDKTFEEKMHDLKQAYEKAETNSSRLLFIKEWEILDVEA